MDGEVLLDVYDSFRAWFWNKTFWLPENRTWADLKRNNTPGSPFYPDIYDLNAAFPIAIGLFLARMIWERYELHSIVANDVITARCTLVQSAVLRSHVVCPSVCPSVCL